MAITDYVSLSHLWQLNVGLSLLLIAILCVRTLIRRSSKLYNAYWLWLSVPIALIAAYVVPLLPVERPALAAVDLFLTQPNNPILITSASTPIAEQTHYLLTLWILIALALLLRLLMQHLQLRKDLSAIQTSAVNVSQKLGTRPSTYPVITVSKTDFSPAVYGFIQPRIYFPVQLFDSLNDEQIHLILQHEEQHIRQGHLWLNLLWDVAVCLFWFNPLIYLARLNFRHDQELYCDYLVLHQRPDNDQHSYGLALLNTITATHSVSLLCSWKSMQHLEERIMNIKHPIRFYQRALLLTGCLVVTGCASLYAMNTEEESSVTTQSSVSKTAPYRFSFHHNEDDYGNRHVVWNTDGKSFVEENGEQYVVENDVRREMTEAERRDFERTIESSNNELKAQERELARKERRVAEQERRAAEREHQKVRRVEREMQRREQKVLADAKRWEEQTKRLDEKMREVERLELEKEFKHLESVWTKEHEAAFKQAERDFARSAEQLKRELEEQEWVSAKHFEMIEDTMQELVENFEFEFDEVEFEQEMQKAAEAFKEVQKEFEKLQNRRPLAPEQPTPESNNPDPVAPVAPLPAEPAVSLQG